MDTSSPVTHIGLCAGYGGIELGLHRAVPNLRSVALCEIEAFAIANLVSKMEAGLMDPAPIWPDLKTFPWAAFRDRVDILTGGYPCQPFSAAGQRKGKQDPRHLWPFIADGIRLLRPKLCFFENVEGHISLGLSDVIEDLAGMGYRTTWGIFSASECGAPHQRKRVFILAYRDNQGLSIRERIRGVPEDEMGAFPRQVTASDHFVNAWPSRPGEQQYGWEPPRVVSGQLDNPAGTGSWCKGGDIVHQGRQTSNSGTTSLSQDAQRQTGAAIANDQSTGRDGGEAMADSHHIDRSAQAEGREHDQQAGPAGEELGDTECQRQEERQLPTGGSEQSDQNMADTGIIGCDGRPDGISRWSRESGETSEDAAGCGGESNGMRQTQPSLGRDTDGSAGGMDYAELCVSGDNRTDELRLLGNGVVPATAERAFRVLMKELYTAPAVS